MSDCKYPNIDVELIGKNGNAFNLLAITEQQMRRAQIPKDEIETFRKEAMSGDYDNLLITIMKWVNIT